MPHGIYGEVTTAAGDALSPNTLKQSAQMISHTHTHTQALTDEEIRRMEVSEQNEKNERKTSRKLIKHEGFFFFF